MVPSAPLPLFTWEVQRRGVRSGRHGAPGDRQQWFLVLRGGFSFTNLPGAEGGGGRGPDYAADERGEPVLSRGGRRRRQAHKEGGERTPRGRARGGGAAAWIGPAQGEVGGSGLRLVEHWLFSIRVGIGRTVRPGDEMAAGPGELGGGAARTPCYCAD